MIEELIINSMKEEEEGNMIIKLEKIINFKTLKRISFKSFNLDDKIISKIKGENLSVKKLSIILTFGNFKLYNLKNIFPNLSLLYIADFDYSKIVNLKIKNVTTNNIGLERDTESLKLSLESYKDLEEFEIIWPQIIKDNLIFLNEKCEDIFKSLINFGFECSNLSIYELKNLFYHINNAKILRKFHLSCKCDEINEKDLFEFIRIILSLNLNYIYLDINGSGKYYSLEDLKRIYPLFTLTNFTKITIYNPFNFEKKK